jgi:hypothetical protein
VGRGIINPFFFDEQKKVKLPVGGCWREVIHSRRIGLVGSLIKVRNKSAQQPLEIF